MSHTKEAIDRFEAGAPVLSRAIQGLSRTELNAFPIPGTWSIQQIVQHVLDSDLIATHRMKRIIAEDNPLLIGYNETLFAQRLGYERLGTELACDLFRLNRELMVQILRQLPETMFARSGVHNERGKVSLLQLVNDYADHLDHHMKFLRDKRTRLGKPL